MTARPAPTTTEPPGGTVLAALYETRWYDPHHRPPGMGNHYCPRCSCNKSGTPAEPNGSPGESCTWPGWENAAGRDVGCICHDDDLVFAESLP